MRATAIALVVLQTLVASMAHALEEPAYTVEQQTDAYELRRYDPYLVAQTTVDGSFRSAGNEAFRILAGYIFGDNVPAQKMAMTAPVVSQTAREGAKMAMTAPVLSAGTRDGENAYVYQFVMERKYTMDTLPTPVDERVTLLEVPERLVAAHRFSGTWSEKRIAEHTDELLATLRADGYTVVGEPALARYNGPMTPWFLRRNEILVEVVPAG